MLELGATIGRQHAHDVVYDAAQAAFVEGRSFSDLLAADPRVTEHLDAARRSDKLLDPAAYTGLCADMAREAAGRAQGRCRSRRGEDGAPHVTGVGRCRGADCSAAEGRD